MTLVKEIIEINLIYVLQRNNMNEMKIKSIDEMREDYGGFITIFKLTSFNALCIILGSREY